MEKVPLQVEIMERKEFLNFLIECASKYSRPAYVDLMNEIVRDNEYEICYFISFFAELFYEPGSFHNNSEEEMLDAHKIMSQLEGHLTAYLLDVNSYQPKLRTYIKEANFDFAMYKDILKDQDAGICGFDSVANKWLPIELVGKVQVSEDSRRLFNRAKGVR